MGITQLRNLLTNRYKCKHVYNYHEIRNFSNDDSKVFNEDGSYNPEELNAFLERNKKKNYMKAACMRMIKNYLDRLYDGWKFYEKDYLVYVNDFKKFG